MSHQDIINQLPSIGSIVTMELFRGLGNDVLEAELTPNSTFDGIFEGIVAARLSWGIEGAFLNFTDGTSFRFISFGNFKGTFEQYKIGGEPVHAGVSFRARINSIKTR